MPDLRRLLWMRGIRAFGDGYVSLLLPVYLTHLRLSSTQIGVLTTVTLFGSGLLTLAVGMLSSRFGRRPLFRIASVLMAATGVGFAATTAYWPLLIIAFAGTLNPSSGDVGIFMPLEQSAISQVASEKKRTQAFARSSLVAYLAESGGELSAMLPDLAVKLANVDQGVALRSMFLLYGALGVWVWRLSRRLTQRIEAAEKKRNAGLEKSKKTAVMLAAIFALDSFAAGFVVQSMLALWLFRRFGLSLSAASTIFVCTSLLSALSVPLAPRIAKRLGLVRTMVSMHVAANAFLLAVALAPSLSWALAALFMRSALAQLDTPARRSYVMGIVPEEERAAVASVTNVPRSFASAPGPAMAGYLLNLTTFGWPIVIAATLKIAHDAVFLVLFRNVRPPEEQANEQD